MGLGYRGVYALSLGLALASPDAPRDTDIHFPLRPLRADMVAQGVIVQTQESDTRITLKRFRGPRSKGFMGRKRTRCAEKPERCHCGRVKTICYGAGQHIIKMGRACGCGDVRC